MDDIYYMNNPPEGDMQGGIYIINYGKPSNILWGKFIIVGSHIFMYGANL